jgi:stearoyl-CoA desaturase (Delta-9 desaturase)
MIESLLISLVAAFFVTQIAVFSTTIYLHRGLTHRALVFHPIAAGVLRFFTWITTGIIPRQWVAVHRKHHAHTDKEGDPHSPLLEGFWSVQLGNVFHYVREARNPEILEQYARDLQPDVWDQRLFDRGKLGPLFGTILLCLLLGLGWGLLAALIHMLMYVFVLSSSINGLCHWLGYKNFDNTATNIRTLALFTGGEGLHNNHHARQTSPKFSSINGRILEYDPAWPIIWTLVKLGLVKLKPVTSGV